MRTKNYILLLLLIFISNAVYSQANENEILSRNQNGQPKLIKLKETKISFEKKSTEDFIRKQYRLNENTSFEDNYVSEFRQIKTKKLQQYFKGIKVEFGQIVISAKNNQIKSINGNVLNIENLDINPKISEQNALNFALQKVNALSYAWENTAMENLLKEETNKNNATYFPKGELVIIDRNLYDDIQEPVLAYKFDIYSLNPISRSNYYVDASDGKILLVDAILKHVEGTAATRYSGNRTIETELNAGNFRLRDNTRGNGILTLNANHVFFDANGNLNLNGATDFTDGNNDWTAVEFDNANRDNAALDAHWGAEMTYDYFLQNHNRNSIDDNGYQLRNYVHVGTDWGNAAWDGQRMLYGDGNFVFDALTSIDVIGHEIGHGLDENTSNLLYERESGAIDEGLSDIWGAMVEFFAAPEKDTYLVGEEIMLNANNLRSMSNPNNSFVAQPDTYDGNFWQNPNCNNPDPNQNDNCGVHTNSGIMNYWFFLLAEGGNGVNDNGDSYNVSGVGKTKAARIVYRAQTVYFNSLTTYHDARDLTINAAEDLHGEESVEVYNVANAWYAVGVGPQPQLVSHYIQGPTQLTPGYRAIYTINPYENATNYVWSIPSGCYQHYCWNINYGQGSNRINITAGNTGVQEINCIIYNGSNIIGSQYLTVNVQNPYGGGGGGGSDPCGGIEPIDGVIYPPDPCDPNTLVAENIFFRNIAIYDFTGKTIMKSKNID